MKIGIDGSIEEDEGSSEFGGVPEADVGFATRPGGGGGGNGEDEVAALGGARGRGEGREWEPRQGLAEEKVENDKEREDQKVLEARWSEESVGHYLVTSSVLISHYIESIPVKVLSE